MRQYSVFVLCRSEGELRKTITSLLEKAPPGTTAHTMVGGAPNGEILAYRIDTRNKKTRDAHRS